MRIMRQVSRVLNIGHAMCLMIPVIPESSDPCYSETLYPVSHAFRPTIMPLVWFGVPSTHTFQQAPAGDTNYFYQTSRFALERARP
jgi:hypothetical protein